MHGPNLPSQSSDGPISLPPLRAMHLHIPASALKVDFEMEGSRANRNTFAQRPKLAANSWAARVV